MMAADANIFQQYMKAPKSVQEYTDEANASQAQQQIMQKNALELQTTQQGIQRSNALRNLVAGLPADPKQRITALRASGNPEAYAAADALEKAQFDREKQAADTILATAHAGKYGADTRASNYDLDQKKREQSIREIANTKTPQDALASIDRHVADGKLTPEQAITAKQSIPMDPIQFHQYQLRAITGLMTPKDQVAQISPDANARLSAETSRANNSANNAVSIRGQNMVDARTRESTTATHGKAPAGYRYLPDGSMQAIPGGPADVKTQAIEAQKAAGATDVDSAVATLRNAYDRLEKGGGITSTKNGVLSNIAASSSSSGLGQVAGRALGTDNQSARNDIAMTRPALLAALMKATGMSAKQMDSNAELKLWMATATDPQLDVESNRRALNAIERKYITARGNQPVQPSPGLPTEINDLLKKYGG